MGKKAKKGKKKKKNAGNQEPAEPIDEFTDLPMDTLRDQIDAFNERLSKAAKDRNYAQLEKDMVNRFYTLTKQEVHQIEAELLNLDRHMETLERDHRVHIKVHEQKVQNLEYEHKSIKREVHENGEASIQKEEEAHTDRVLQMNREKISIKSDLNDQQLANEEEVRRLQMSFANSLAKLRKTFEQNFKQLEQTYEEQMEQQRIDQELQRKVEIHEIEERKNQHINELLFNHQEAFDNIKSYYNDITGDNLQLIRSLLEEIHDTREKEKENQKKMAILTQGIKELSVPLAQKLEEQRDLEEKLKSFTKDKMALKNLRAYSKQLSERIQEARQEYRVVEDKYRKIEKERDDLYRRFQKAVREIQRKAELGKNAVLEKKLEYLQEQFEKRQMELSSCLNDNDLDATVVSNVTKKLGEVISSKQKRIKDLQYQVHLCTKAYNDTIRVYEAKLPSLGIDPEEIGFEQIQTATSLMPASLVTRTM